jgi:hypothetical protein
LETSAGSALAKTGDLKAAASFVGWLAGSISGIVAIMYGVGFLGFHAHMDMLGLDFNSNIPNTVYLQNGAKFFYLSAIIIMENVFLLIVDIFPLILVVVASIVAVVSLVLFVISGFKPARFKETTGKLVSSFKSSGEKPSKISQGLYFLILAGVLLWGIWQYPFFFTPVKLSGVLYQECKQKPGVLSSEISADNLLCNIQNDERSEIREFYGILLNESLVLFLFVVVLRKIFLQTLILKIAFAPVLLLFLICLLVLPINYGKLIMSNEYPLIGITLKTGSPVRIPEGRLFLISQAEKRIVLWHPDTKKAVMMDPNQVAAIEISKRISLFSFKSPGGQKKLGG